MPHLRTPKSASGLALGLPSLPFRRWYTAQHGEEAWQRMHKFPTADWHDYLGWFRRVLALPVRNTTEVTHIRPHGTMIEVATNLGSHFARWVVLATGGYTSRANGIIQAGISRDLWPDRAAHSGEAIDFSRLVGRRVAVVGGNASAWDAAWAALTAGVGHVDLYVRRKELHQVNYWVPSLQMQGYAEGWPTLPLEGRWRLSCLLLRDRPSVAPNESVRRVIAYPNVTVHLGRPILEAQPVGDQVGLRIGPAPGRVATADFLVLATGFEPNLDTMPELAAVAPHVAAWEDRYTPPDDLRWPGLARQPFLGEGFELQEREPGVCPSARLVHLFNHAAFASLGMLAVNISASNIGAERLAQRIAAAFAIEDADHMRATILGFSQQELLGTPFHAAPEGIWFFHY